MLRLLPIPARPAQSDEPEWMDAPGHPRSLIDDNLDDLRRVNWLLGGRRLTLSSFARLAERVPRAERLVVLDVATGAADIPRAIARWGARVERPVLVVATDFHEAVLVSGRDHEPAPPSVVFCVADATALPFRDGAFHVAASSLALHHLSPPQAERAFREQRRCTTIGVVVNDVVRSWFALGGAYLATRLGSTNRLTHHDGPLSVRRAFTVPEIRRLACAAGLKPLEWRSFLFYRVALIAVPDPGIPEELNRSAPSSSAGRNGR
ncbi:MAG TPA: methyltransferase domain-containing protein [Chloroflexota bacterium]|nr:methyltransferase domain-containing protein [Chloroflexota bacterium]